MTAIRSVGDVRNCWSNWPRERELSPGKIIEVHEAQSTAALAASALVHVQKLPVKLPVKLPGWQRDALRRQVAELQGHVQRLLRGADATHNAFLLDRTTLIRTLAPRGERFRMARVPEQSAEVFAREVVPFKKTFFEEVIGRIDAPVLPPDPRSRRVYDTPKWAGYEVTTRFYEIGSIEGLRETDALLRGQA